VLQRVKRGARREHPAAKQARRRFARTHFPDIQKCSTFRQIFGRALIAMAHNDFQRTKAHRFPKVDPQGGDARGNLIQALQHGGTMRFRRRIRSDRDDRHQNCNA